MSKPLLDRKKLDNSPSYANSQPKSRSGSFRVTSKESSLLIGEHKEDTKPEKLHRENEVLPSTEADEEVQHKDDLASLELDPIFRRLCPKDEYKEDPTCKVCDIKFNALKFRTRKICEFCGNSYCDEHAKRKRANPENADEFVRICSVCDEKYVKRRILQEFEAELNERERVLEFWENEVRMQQEDITFQQMELNALLLEKGRSERNYSEKMNYLTNDIARIKEETKKLDKEHTVLTKEFEEIHKRATDWEETILDSKREYQRLLVELSMLNNQIEAVNQDLQLVNKHLKLNNAKELISKRNDDNVQPLVVFAEKIRKDSVTQNEDSKDESMSHYGSQRLIRTQPGRRRRKDETLPACTCSKCNIF